MSEQTKSKLLGDFGEYLLTWFLRSKFKIEASLVKREGLDILCNDNEGSLFPKRRNIAISVRTRELNKNNLNKTIDANWSKIEDASKAWRAIPYFAYVQIYPEGGIIRVFILPVSKAKKIGKEFSVVKAQKKASNILFEMQFNNYSQLQKINS